jgi:hypothetical protein
VPRLRIEPYHEPIGISPETYRTSRRWVVAASAIIAVLLAAVIRLAGILR